MPANGYPKVFSAVAAGILLVVSAIAGLLAQTSQPSPTPTPQISPAVTASPSPAALAPPTPSPTIQTGAQNFHQWGSITLFNGLPSDSVRAIAQTADGVMWFGTENGLARFDGRRIQNFSFGGSDANRVLALKAPSSGGLWVGTQKGAFFYYDSGFQPVAGTEGFGITSMLLDDDVLLGTDIGLVLKVKAHESGGFAAENVFPNPLLTVGGIPLSITSLIKKDGKLLAATPGRGVFMIQDGSASELPSTPRPVFVNSLAQSATGKLWLGTDAAKGLGGIYSLENTSRVQRIAAPTANVLALETREDGLWAGTARYGLFNIANSGITKNYTFENTSGGLRSNTIFALFTDREGVIWIGTNRGVSRFDPTGPIQETVSDIPNRNFIRVLWRPPHALFAGSNRGLFESDGKLWNRVRGFEEEAIYAIRDFENGLVVGTSTGTFDSRGKLLAIGDTRSIEKFGKVYAAILGKGVVDVTSGTQNVIFPDETACSLLAGRDRLWIGTAGHGLFSFDGRNVKSEVPPEILKSGTIWNMSLDADQNVWIAGEHGVFRVRDGQAEQIIVAEDVRDVFVSGADIWAATTTRGLLHARHDEQFGWLVSAMGFEQGLPSEKAFSIVPVDGLLIATNRGVVTYHPHTITPKLIPIRVLSQRFHDLSEVRSTIALDYTQNSVLVEVAGQSSRTFPEEFQYSYLLRNSRGEIINSRLSNDPQYAPADLKPGEYSIESRAYDRDLNASEPLIIRFSIAKAPFPLTATALGVLLAIALVGLIWAVVEHRRIKQRNRELAAARFDLANEAERERSRIARDLHDQTLADLRNLMMMSDRLSPPNADFRSEIESVSTEIRRICEDLSPSVLENVGLVAALEFLLSRSAENHEFSNSEDANDQVKFPVIVQLHIYRIAQEILTNIDRHSDATRVKMSVEISDEGRFLMTIRDDGGPFQPGRRSGKARGIANIRSRASLIGAAIEWKPLPDGNEFILDVAGKDRV